jgi:hypothetical protein
MAAVKKKEESGKAAPVKAGAAKGIPAVKKPVKFKAAKASKATPGGRKSGAGKLTVLCGGPEDGLNPGTVIGVDRGLYKHYGIYAGSGSIIHYASATGDFGYAMGVRKTGVKHFLAGTREFFVCEFPNSHGKPREQKKNADIFSALTSSLTGGGLFGGNENPLSAIIAIYELFKKINYKLYSPAETLRRAKSRLGESSYNLVFNNCEHFVVWCKTGVSESHQVNTVIRAITGSGEVIKTV